MIEGNVIYNGYGDVLVTCHHCYGGMFGNFALKLSQIEPPVEVGDSVYGKEYEIIREIFIPVSRQELSNLLNCLREIDSENCRITFKGYEIDFSNYNPKSVLVYIKALECAIANYLIPLAC
jgi:hypothetical protein